MRSRLLWGVALSLAVPACESPTAAPPHPGAPSLAKVGLSSFLDVSGLAARRAELVEAGGGFGFTEGPAVDRFANVFFTDQPNDRIYRRDRNTGVITLFLEGTGRSNGMMFDKDGDLITAADMHGQLWSIDKDGDHTVLVDGFDGKPFNGPNDLWIAPNGGIYFTDPLFERDYWDDDDPRRLESQQGGEFIYYLSPDRQAVTRVGEVQGAWPNGVIGTPDGKTLYVVEMLPVTGTIYAYDINPDGTLSGRRFFAYRPWPDGMSIDARGNVYVAGGDGPDWPSGIDAFSPDGERILHVPSGEGWTANLTFGGPNRKSLVITAGSKVFVLDMHVRGVK